MSSVKFLTIDKGLAGRLGFKPPEQLHQQGLCIAAKWGDVVMAWPIIDDNRYDWSDVSRSTYFDKLRKTHKGM